MRRKMTHEDRDTAEHVCVDTINGLETYINISSLTMKDREPHNHPDYIWAIRIGQPYVDELCIDDCLIVS